MTEDSRPDPLSDPDLERYLKGDSRLSRAYRAASTERTPAELDAAILAAAKREVRARPGVNKVLAPVALAASLILGVNLAWNLHRAAPPVAAPAAQGNLKQEAAPPASNAPQLREDERMLPAQALPSRIRNAAEPDMKDRLEQLQAEARQRNQEMAEAKRKASEDDAAKLRAEERAERSMAKAEAAPPAAMAAAGAPAPPPPLTESRKIDRLLAYTGSLSGAVFIRNGEEHTPAEAVEHMKLKRDKAGDRVKTAEDFIRYCASYSTLSGKAYLIRFPDGRTRTAEDVLREELARINASAQ